MEAHLVRPIVRPRAPLPSLTRWTIASLLGTALTFVYLQVFIVMEVSGPAIALSVIAVLLAGVVATGWRWAPLVGFVGGAWLTVVTLPHIIVELTQPNETHLFAWVTVRLAIILLGGVAGVAATVRNYRGELQYNTPRWFSSSLVAVSALGLGSILVALIPQNTSAVGISPDVIANAPAVKLNDFNGGTVRVKAGQVVALRLDTRGSPGHTFDVDELNIHTPMPAAKIGLAVFQAVQPGTYIFYCAPHYDKASGTGMRGTLVVEP